MNEAQPRIAFNRCEIFAPAGGEIVDDNDGLFFGEQPFDEMRADEAGAAGDEDVGGAWSVGAWSVGAWSVGA